jgi:polyisoprenoid-binding protein YceI
VAGTATITLGPSAGITPPKTQKPGQRLILLGTVYAEDCTPLPGVTLNVWQTNADGEYGPGHDTNNLQCCYLQGAVRTDANGRYQLITVMPGHYRGQSSPPPAHIHVEAHHPDAEPGGAEIVFADDPYLPRNADDTDGYVVVTLAEATGPELIDGALQISLAEPPTVHALTVTVDLRGLVSDDPQRDEKLADRWLVTTAYPFATFTFVELQNAPAQYAEGESIAFTLVGDMTLRDVTRSMPFAVTARLAGDTVTGSASAMLKMTEYGIEPPDLLGFVKVEDEVRVKVDFTAREAAD